MVVVYCVGKQAGCFCVDLVVSFDFYTLSAQDQRDELVELLARAVGVHHDQVFLWQADHLDEHAVPHDASVFRRMNQPNYPNHAHPNHPNYPNHPNQPIPTLYFDVANQIDMTVLGTNFEASEMVRNRDVPEGLQLVNHRCVIRTVSNMTNMNMLFNTNINTNTGVHGAAPAHAGGGGGGVGVGGE